MHAIQYTVYMHNFAHARVYERAVRKKCANMTPKNGRQVFNMGFKNAEYSADSNLLNWFKNTPKYVIDKSPKYIFFRKDSLQNLSVYFRTFCKL